MNAIVHRIVESKLSDFKGLAIEGEIPVSEQIINDMIRLFIEDMNAAAEKTKPENAGTAEKKEAETSSTDEEGIDINKLMSALDEKNLSIELKEKQLVIKVNARKY